MTKDLYKKEIYRPRRRLKTALIKSCILRFTHKQFLFCFHVFSLAGVFNFAIYSGDFFKIIIKQLA